jgi:hypothetical protein
MAKRKRKNRGPFVAVPKHITATAAWLAMSPYARLLWIELRGWLRNDDLNNGKLFRSCRDAAKALGSNKDTMMLCYTENEHFGFLRKTAGGFLGVDGRGIAAQYRFTDLPYGAHPPTRDFEKWDGSPFVCGPRRPGRKIQNPARKLRTPCPQSPDIRKSHKRGAVCPQSPDIGRAAHCPQSPDTSSLPSPRAKEAKLQGSLTARAPAQAGGAGSSPAPVAKEEA